MLLVWYWLLSEYNFKLRNSLLPFLCRLLEELVQKEREFQVLLQQAIEERNQEIKNLKLKSQPIGNCMSRDFKRNWLIRQLTTKNVEVKLLKCCCPCVQKGFLPCFSQGGFWFEVRPRAVDINFVSLGYTLWENTGVLPCLISLIFKCFFPNFTDLVALHICMFTELINYSNCRIKKNINALKLVMWN